MREWIKSSFRNRIFVTVLLVTLLPMLLCDVFVMQIAISSSEDMLRQQAMEELEQLEQKLNAMIEQADEITSELAGKHGGAQRSAPGRQRLKTALSGYVSAECPDSGTMPWRRYTTEMGGAATAATAARRMYSFPPAGALCARRVRRKA